MICSNFHLNFLGLIHSQILLCFSGIYDIQPKANIFKTVINGPKFIVNVQPDPLKPSAVEVSYNPKMTITAGQTFPGKGSFIQIILTH